MWQLTGEVGSGREQRALRLVAIGFLVLGVYIAAQATIELASRGHPGRSILAIVWLPVTIGAMLTRAAGKRHAGHRLGNAVLLAEERVTVIDGALAGTVLIGVVLNAAAGWWWADAVSALAILVFGLREARHPWLTAG